MFSSGSSSYHLIPFGIDGPSLRPLAASVDSDQRLGLPITPPTIEGDPKHEKILFTAVQVLSAEATALSHLSRLYATDLVARDGFVKAVGGITHSLGQGGKIVVVGVGKSGKVGQKLVATMNSLGLLSYFMHPVEALHGDLGLLRPNDILLLITFSGNTPELVELLPHLPFRIPVIVLTSHMAYHTSKLTSSRSNTILLPAPIPESEESTFGLSAPTTSTTVAMALGDALALAAARAIYAQQGRSPCEVFKRNHPGGAIGLNIGKMSMKISELVIPLESIPAISEDYSLLDLPASSTCSASPTDSESDTGWSAEGQVRVLDCLLSAVRAPGGWLKISNTEVIPPRRLQRVRNPQSHIRDPGLDLVVSQDRWIKVRGDASIDEVRKMIIASRAGVAKDNCIPNEPVIAVMAQNSIIGVVETEDVLEGR